MVSFFAENVHVHRACEKIHTLSDARPQTYLWSIFPSEMLDITHTLSIYIYTSSNHRNCDIGYKHRKNQICIRLCVWCILCLNLSFPFFSILIYDVIMCVLVSRCSHPIMSTNIVTIKKFTDTHRTFTKHKTLHILCFTCCDRERVKNMFCHTVLIILKTTHKTSNTSTHNVKYDFIFCYDFTIFSAKISIINYVTS